VPSIVEFHRDAPPCLRSGDPERQKHPFWDWAVRMPCFSRRPEEHAWLNIQYALGKPSRQVPTWYLEHSTYLSAYRIVVYLERYTHRTIKEL